jgi:hypothetical protein
VSFVVEEFAENQFTLLSPALHGGRDVFDLSQFSKHDVFSYLEVRLSNKATLNLLADQLNGIDRLKTEFRTLKFASNGIQTLESFTKLYGFLINVLDLRHNRIASLQEFHFLKHLTIEELYLAGNDCTRIENYRERIFEIVPCLKIVDGQQRASTAAASTSLMATLETLKKGKRGNGQGNDPILKIDEGIVLKATKRKNEDMSHMQRNFQAYKREIDNKWTQVQIFHHNLSFEAILDELMPRIFNSCQFFPCYLKRMGGKYEFFLYKNFDALRIIMDTSNNLTYAMPPTGAQINFTLRLNAAAHVDGQVDWFHKVSWQGLSGVLVILRDFW